MTGYQHVYGQYDGYYAPDFHRQDWRYSGHYGEYTGGPYQSHHYQEHQDYNYHQTHQQADYGVWIGLVVFVVLAIIAYCDINGCASKAKKEPAAKTILDATVGPVQTNSAPVPKKDDVLQIIPVSAPCQTCGHVVLKGVKQCPVCTRPFRSSGAVISTCRICNGSGTLHVGRCGACKGAGNYAA